MMRYEHSLSEGIQGRNNRHESNQISHGIGDGLFANLPSSQSDYVYDETNSEHHNDQFNGYSNDEIMTNGSDGSHNLMSEEFDLFFLGNDNQHNDLSSNHNQDDNNEDFELPDGITSSNHDDIGLSFPDNKNIKLHEATTTAPVKKKRGRKPLANKTEKPKKRKYTKKKNKSPTKKSDDAPKRKRGRPPLASTKAKKEAKRLKKEERERKKKEQANKRKYIKKSKNEENMEDSTDFLKEMMNSTSIITNAPLRKTNAPIILPNPAPKKTSEKKLKLPKIITSMRDKMAMIDDMENEEILSTPTHPVPYPKKIDNLLNDISNEIHTPDLDRKDIPFNLAKDIINNSENLIQIPPRYSGEFHFEKNKVKPMQIHSLLLEQQLQQQQLNGKNEMFTDFIQTIPNLHSFQYNPNNTYQSKMELNGNNVLRINNMNAIANPMYNNFIQSPVPPTLPPNQQLPPNQLNVMMNPPDHANPPLNPIQQQTQLEKKPKVEEKEKTTKKKKEKKEKKKESKKVSVEKKKKEKKEKKKKTTTKKKKKKKDEIDVPTTIISEDGTRRSSRLKQKAIEDQTRKPKEVHQNSHLIEYANMLTNLRLKSYFSNGFTILNFSLSVHSPTGGNLKKFDGLFPSTMFVSPHHYTCTVIANQPLNDFFKLIHIHGFKNVNEFHLKLSTESQFKATKVIPDAISTTTAHSITFNFEIIPSKEVDNESTNRYKFCIGDHFQSKPFYLMDLNQELIEDEEVLDLAKMLSRIQEQDTYYDARAVQTNLKPSTFFDRLLPYVQRKRHRVSNSVSLKKKKSSNGSKRRYTKRQDDDDYTVFTDWPPPTDDFALEDQKRKKRKKIK